jgi:hypothetical protein
MASPDDVLQGWLAQLSAIELVDSGDVDSIAAANLEMFSIAEAQDARVTSSALGEFLRDAHRAYSTAAARTELSAGSMPGTTFRPGSCA